MAEQNIFESSLRLYFIEDNDELTGEPIFKTKNLSNIRVDAQPAAMLSVVNALASLQQRVLHLVERRDASTLKSA